MNIALAHFRIKDIDGVSLEMEKWKIILRKMGHTVYFIAGNGTDTNSLIIEELKYDHPRNNRIVKNAYRTWTDFPDEDAFKNEIFEYADRIEKKLLKIIDTYNIDIIIPNNIFSLGWNISAAIAFYNTSLKTKTKTFCHHHDFWWEREKYSVPTLAFVSDILEKYFPPKHPLFTHIVINKIAQKALLDYKEMESHIVPTAFDFDADSWEMDDYNYDFRERIGVKNNDLIFLQATRIVERKGIELAIDIVAAMNRQRDKLVNRKLYNDQFFTTDSSIYLVFSNLNESENYYNQLIQYAQEKEVKVLDISHHIQHSREIKNREKKYTLWDTYVFADIVTYPSILEGWGNQFIEAIFAERPVVVFEYPVFKTDIKHFNFNVISLGDRIEQRKNGFKKVSQQKIEEAIQLTIKYVTDKNFRKNRIAENFGIGRRYLSLQSLENNLKQFF